MASRFFHHQLPLLMIPHPGSANTACFFTLTHEKKLKELEFELSIPYQKRFIGSSFGWLISIDKEFSITLFNPFAGANNTMICLPPVICSKMMKEDGNYEFETLGEYCFNHEYYLTKAILSGNPSSLHSADDELVLMVIYGEYQRLACIRFTSHGVRKGGEESKEWVYFDRDLIQFSDIIYSNSDGLFYAVQSTGKVYSINLDHAAMGEEGSVITCISPTLGSPCYGRYIVESCQGDLYQVLRFGEWIDRCQKYITSKFQVFKLHHSSQVPQWVELESLDDDVLFVGDNSSLSVSASDFPECRPGSIYYLFGYDLNLFTVEKFVRRGRLDMGLFTLETQRFGLLEIMELQNFYYDMAKRPRLAGTHISMSGDEELSFSGFNCLSSKFLFSAVFHDFYQLLPPSDRCVRLQLLHFIL